MSHDASQADTLDPTPSRVSVRFILCVILGLYLVGYGVYRFNSEPPGYIWLGFQYRDPGFKEYLSPFKDIWESRDPVGIKIFHTLYVPCYVVEDWIIYRLLW